MTDLQATLHPFVLQNWTAFAVLAVCGPAFLDDPGYVLIRGPLAPPVPYLALEAGIGRHAGAAVHLVRCRPGPAWVDVDPEADHAPGTLEFAAVKRAGCGGVVAWEPDGGRRVWVAVDGPTNPLDEHDALLVPDLPAQLN